MENLLQELDQRYVKKDELSQEVTNIVDGKFMTKEDCNTILGKMNAMEIELVKNTEILNKIYNTSEDTKLLQITQRSELDSVQQVLKKAQKNLLSQIWGSLPTIIRALVTFLLFFMFLIAASMMIGREADNFIRENGLYVTIFTGAASLFIGKSGGVKK